MGSSQSYYSEEIKHQINKKTPDMVNKSMKIYEDNKDNREQEIHKLVKDILNTGFGYLRGFDEVFIAGISTGYVIYIRQLYDDNTEIEIIESKLNKYFNDIVTSIDKGEITV